MKLVRRAISALVVVAVASHPAAAAPAESGELDKSFGGDGTVTTDFVWRARTTDALLQRDGRIIVVGDVNRRDFEEDDVALARYLPDGSLDPSFGRRGRLRLDGSSTASALTPSGRILIAGSDESRRRSYWAITRLLQTGEVDPSFGQNGALFDSDLYFLMDLAVLESGAFLVAGSVSSDGCFTLDAGLEMYRPDGSRDRRFGANGRISLDLGGDSDGFEEVAVDRKGRFVAAGWSANSDINADDRSRFAVARFLRDGSLDPSFGEDGIVLLPRRPNRNDYVQALLLGERRIFIAGDRYTLGDSDSRIAVVALRLGGRPDPDFGDDGIVLINPSRYTDLAGDIGLSPRGRLLVSATRWATVRDSTFEFVRLRRNGTRDLAFGGGDGRVMTTFGRPVSELSSTFVLPDGRFVAAGWSGQSWRGGDFAVTRYLP